jgi:hypothetical protein
MILVGVNRCRIGAASVAQRWRSGPRDFSAVHRMPLRLLSLFLMRPFAHRGELNMPSIPFVYRPRPHRPRRHHSFKAPAFAPAPPPPPPPPVEYVNVNLVIPWGGDADVAIWVFSQDIEDPVSEDAPGLVINGAAGVAWEREDTNALRVQYEDEVVIGQAWTCAAGAAGIIGESGDALAAGSGEVQTPG